MCRNGYYRGDADQPDEPCTSEFILHDMACTLTFLYNKHLYSCKHYPFKCKFIYIYINAEYTHAYKPLYFRDIVEIFFLYHSFFYIHSLTVINPAPVAAFKSATTARLRSLVIIIALQVSIIDVSITLPMSLSLFPLSYLPFSVSFSCCCSFFLSAIIP